MRTTAIIAAKIGCSPSTVTRSARRQGMSLTDSDAATVAKIKDDIAIGKGQSPKGHWPKGKRRNTGLQAHRLTMLMTRIEKERRRGGWSLASVARYCGVSDRAVRRWLTLEHFPGDQNLIQLQAWLAADDDQRNV